VNGTRRGYAQGDPDKSSEFVDRPFRPQPYIAPAIADFPRRGAVMRFAFLVVCAMAMGAVYEAHQYVISQITSGEPRIALPQAPPLLSGPIDWSNFHVGLPIDEKEIRRLNAESLASQIQESNRRMQDMAAYTRNPAGWHGLPPH
jgi:hypothetical protein